MRVPDFQKAFDYENDFWLSCQPERVSKILIHYELFKMSLQAAGDIVECGVFRGASFCRFSVMRELFAPERKLVGFDIFGKFPDTAFAGDQKLREKFIREAGAESATIEQLQEILENKGVTKNVELVKGDICQTVPEYVKQNPEQEISLLHLDTDIYEPAVVILENFWPKLSKNGVLVIDDYQVFPGETKAVDDFFKGKNVEIKRFPYRKIPYYVVKKD